MIKYMTRMYQVWVWTWLIHHVVWITSSSPTVRATKAYSSSFSMPSSRTNLRISWFVELHNNQMIFLHVHLGGHFHFVSAEQKIPTDWCCCRTSCSCTPITSTRCCSSVRSVRWVRTCRWRRNSSVSTLALCHKYIYTVCCRHTIVLFCWLTNWLLDWNSVFI